MGDDDFLFLSNNIVMLDAQKVAVVLFTVGQLLGVL
jgi:hypothetical protein